MLTRRNTLSLLGSAIAAPAVLGTGLRSARAEGRPTLRVAVQGLSPSLEPLESVTNVGLRAVDLMFDRPSRRNFIAEAANPGRSVIEPQLATSVTSVDPLTWEMKLRPGVKLHDGSTLSAADIIASFSPDRIGSASPYPEGRVAFGHVDGVTRVDDLTVRIHTKTPDAVMAQRLAAYDCWIVSAKALAAGGPQAMRTNPVGAGPYKLVDFKRDAEVRFASHDDYWMGRPAAQEVRLQMIPEAATRVLGLISGEYDIVTNILPDQVAQLAGYDNVEAVAVPMNLVNLLYYDCRKPIMSDPRIRQALSFAIDYNVLGHAVWGANFQRPNGLQIPSFGDLYDAGRTYFNYDPDRAKKLLAQAGYKGQEITFRIVPGYYLGNEDAAQIIQTMWAAVGVPMRLQEVDLGIEASDLKPGPDVHMVSASFRFPDPLGGGVIVAFGPDSYIQKNGYWTPASDYNAVGVALQQATAPADRQRLFWKMLDLMEQEAPATILYSVNEIIGKRKAVKWTQYPLYYMDFRPDVLSFK